MAKIVSRESEIKNPYEVQVFHDMEKVQNMPWDKGYDFKTYSGGKAFIGKIYQATRGIYQLSDGYIVNFLSLKKATDLWELGIELYDPEGKFLHYTKLGDNLYYDIRCKDASDLFYAIDRKEYHKVITFRLEFPEVDSQ